MTFFLTLSLAASGYHPNSWQVSQSPHSPNARAYQAMARQAEVAGLDAILLGIPLEGNAGSSVQASLST